jgi:transcriptional regulator NrdR family protein
VNCIYCKSGTAVVNSRLQRRSNQTWRRRKCRACGSVFTTHESIDLSSALFVDRAGKLEPFILDQLFTDILLALQDRKDCYVAARETCSTVIFKLLKNSSQSVFEPQQISDTTAKVLKALDKRAYLRYVSEHPSLQ